MMLSVVVAAPRFKDGNAIVAFALTQVDGQRYALIGSDEVFGRTSLGVVLQTASTQRQILIIVVAIARLARFGEWNRIYGSLEGARIPPKQLSIGRNRCTLVTCLALHPKHIPDGIVVGLLYHGHGQRLAFAGRCIWLAQIKVHNQPIVATADQGIRALWIEPQAREGRWRQQLHERRVGVGNVPNIRRGRHVGID